MGRIHSLVGSSLAVVGGARAVGAAPSPVAVKCRSDAFVAYLEPAGRLTLLEYRVGQATVAPTGRNLAYVDARAPNLAPFCARTRPRRLPTRRDRLAGPYPWGRQLTRVYCAEAVRGFVAAKSVGIDVRSVADRTGNRIGSRLTARVDSIVVFDAVVTRTSRRYAFDWSRCQRNPAGF
jgi:hypothetical protein